MDVATCSASARTRNCIALKLCPPTSSNDGRPRTCSAVSDRRMTADDVMLYGKIYQWAVSKMYNEIPCRMVPCGCGADVDQYCIFRHGIGTTPHADRRLALALYVKASDDNRCEYEQLK